MEVFKKKYEFSSSSEDEEIMGKDPLDIWTMFEEDLDIKEGS
jgi:hypothetical protein